MIDPAQQLWKFFSPMVPFYVLMALLREAVARTKLADSETPAGGLSVSGVAGDGCLMIAIGTWACDKADPVIRRRGTWDCGWSSCITKLR
ncbi:MAG: hypothetical protein ACYCST_09280 [Acidimicrobiales bacterium]